MVALCFAVEGCAAAAAVNNANVTFDFYIVMSAGVAAAELISIAAAPRNRSPSVVATVKLFVLS